MGAELGLTALNPTLVGLHNFVDTIVVPLGLKPGNWIVMGRAILENYDGEDQEVSASLLQSGRAGSSGNVEIDRTAFRLRGGSKICIYLQAGALVVEDDGTDLITLVCKTQDGEASWGSLIAIKVDAIA